MMSGCGRIILKFLWRSSRLQRIMPRERRPFYFGSILFSALALNCFPACDCIVSDISCFVLLSIALSNCSIAAAGFAICTMRKYWHLIQTEPFLSCKCILLGLLSWLNGSFERQVWRKGRKTSLRYYKHFLLFTLSSGLDATKMFAQKLCGHSELFLGKQWFSFCCTCRTRF